MTTSSLAISAIQLEDLPDVLRVERRCYDFPWSEQIMRDCLKVGYHTLALREAGIIRAYAFASCAVGEAHILNICVDPDHRGQGHARTLMQQSIATVMAHGAKVVFLEVRESNRVAIGLYESMGFVEIGRRENYYRRKETVNRPGRHAGYGRDSGEHGGKHHGNHPPRKSAAKGNEDALIMSRDLSVVASALEI